jgi:hypothetical protein
MFLHPIRAIFSESDGATPVDQEGITEAIPIPAEVMAVFCINFLRLMIMGC